MSARLLLPAAGLFLLGCGGSGDTPPSAYRHSRDRLIATLGGSVFGQQPCFRTINGQPRVLSIALCYRLEKQRRVRGIWTKAFEESAFYPNRTLPPTQADPDSRIWLELEPGILPERQQRDLERKCGGSCSIYLDFVGRRTSVKGRYGHMGMSDHYLVVDRVFKAEVLEER
jgi:hypothetical protein